MAMVCRRWNQSLFPPHPQVNKEDCFSLGNCCFPLPVRSYTWLLTSIVYTSCLKCRRSPDTWLRSTSWVPLWIALGFGVSRGLSNACRQQLSFAVLLQQWLWREERRSLKRWVLSVRTQTERKGCLPGSWASLRVIEPPWIPFRASKACVSPDCSYQWALFSSL